MEKHVRLSVCENIDQYAVHSPHESPSPVAASGANGPHDQDKKTSQRTQYNRNKQNDNSYLGSILARTVTEETSDQEVELCWTSAGKEQTKIFIGL